MRRGVGSEGKRKPQTRKRCSGNKACGESVEVVVAAAMPQIVRANVRKAKQGSLQHTKWLWGVVEKMPKANGVRTTLAELLMEGIVPRADEVEERPEAE